MKFPKSPNRLAVSRCPFPVFKTTVPIVATYVIVDLKTAEFISTPAAGCFLSKASLLGAELLRWVFWNG